MTSIQPEPMKIPPGQPGTIMIVEPDGLEFMASLDSFVLKQQKKKCLGPSKWYKIKDGTRQQVLVAEKKDDTCGICPSLYYHIKDNYNRAVLTLEGALVLECYCKYKTCMCCNPCLFSQSDTESTSFPYYILDERKQTIGSMKITQSTHKAAVINVYDSSDTELYRIVLPFYYVTFMCLCTRHTYSVLSGFNKVADITRETGLCSGLTKWNITFPKDMHVIHKALLLSSVILLDFVTGVRLSLGCNSSFGCGLRYRVDV